MILVYKFDFAFIQNIKISLINLPCEGDTGQKKDTLCTQSTPPMCRTGDKRCRAPAHKLGPSGDITH